MPRRSWFVHLGPRRTARQLVQPSFDKAQLFGRCASPALLNHKKALPVGRHIKYPVIRKKTYNAWREWHDRTRGRRNQAQLAGNSCAEDLISVCVKEFPAASRPDRAVTSRRGNLPPATRTRERLYVHFELSGFI